MFPIVGMSLNLFFFLLFVCRFWYSMTTIKSARFFLHLLNIGCNHFAFYLPTNQNRPQMNKSLFAYGKRPRYQFQWFVHLMPSRRSVRKQNYLFTLQSVIWYTNILQLTNIKLHQSIPLNTVRRKIYCWFSIYFSLFVCLFVFLSCLFVTYEPNSSNPITIQWISPSCST